MAKSDEIELAWAAGLFAGEGCASLLRLSKRNLAYPNMAVAMYDKRSVERFAKAIAPYVGERIKSKTKGVSIESRINEYNQTVWSCRLAGQPARNVFAVLAPCLANTDKGEQIQRILAEADAQLRPETRQAIKLSRALAREIRLAFVKGETRQQLANRFGVTHQTIGKVINGVIWSESNG